jgi:basic membrane protein A and related proteins
VKKSTLLAPAATIVAAVLALSSCASAPETSSSSPSTVMSAASSSGSTSAVKKACMVSDTGGFDDKSFNETSYAGLQKAVAEFGIEEAKVQSAAATDYATNIQSLVDAGCNVIVTVGYSLGDATVAAAQANPNVEFVIVDNDNSSSGLANLKSLVFNTAQSSFLAGYLAAATSATGKVGTFGGAQYPTVTIFMDGFAQGVEYYNKAKGASVQVLGWDVKSQDGQFTGDFTDPTKGKNTAETLISQGADVIFPVAGNAGTGALEAAKASNGKVKAIWVDTDGCQSAADYCSILETSVQKGLDTAVYEAIKSAVEGNFTNKTYVGTLDNGGTGLAPYHDFESSMPSGLAAEIDQLKADIISGKITITSAAQPAS